MVCMASTESTVGRNLGVNGILTQGLSAVTSDPRISVVQFLSSFISLLPLVGDVLSLALRGWGTEFADRTLGHGRPARSFGGRFVSAIGVSIVSTLAVVLGLLLFIFPGIYLALKFSLAIPAVWIGDQRALDAISESWSRTSGRLGTIFVVGLVLGAVMLLVLLPAFLAFVPFHSPEAVQQMNQQPLYVASAPLFTVSIVLSVTIGAVGTACQAVMYRSFRTPTSNF